MTQATDLQMSRRAKPRAIMVALADTISAFNPYWRVHRN
jgi:hypothetical protein